MNTQEITLMPCISDKVALLQKDGNFVKGWLLDENLNPLKEKEISKEKLALYNTQGYAPRIIYVENEFDFISAHEYLLKLMNVKKQNEKSYCGFSLIHHTANNTLDFSWVSASLNSKRDDEGVVIERTRGAMMPEDYQRKVEEIVSACVPDIKLNRTLHHTAQQQTSGSNEEDPYSTPPSSPKGNR